VVTLPEPHKINVALLRKELEYVTSHRDQWDQRHWIRRTWCGTTGCLAGNIVLNAGYQPVPDRTSKVVSPDHSAHRSVADVASELLGIDYRQAEQLFHTSNDIMDLWEAASSMTNGEIEVPPSVIEEFKNDRYAPDARRLEAILRGEDNRDSGQRSTAT
jgi:hypothetical protein